MSDRQTWAAWVAEARARTLALVADADDRAVPYLPIVNPTAWEIGHVAFFQEYWVLHRTAGQPLEGDAGVFDSAIRGHRTRWDAGLDLPRMRAYLERTRDRVLEVLEREPDARTEYFVTLSVLHEDMHAEALTYTRQTLCWPAPTGVALSCAPELAGDLDVPGGTYRVGSEPGRGFTFDNEHDAQEVHLPPYSISRAPVTEAGYARFLEATGHTPPPYWRNPGDWQVRWFDTWRDLDPRRPVSHVSAFDAEAYCRWAGRRLASEWEWEVAARLYDARAFAWGTHVWEWTATPFAPLPGFRPGPYKEYSEPWFHTHRSLRGGAWATHRRLVRPTYRNFFTPERADVIAGFRTVAA